MTVEPLLLQAVPSPTVTTMLTGRPALDTAVGWYVSPATGLEGVDDVKATSCGALTISSVRLALTVASTLSLAAFDARTTHEPTPVVRTAPVAESMVHGPLTFTYVMAPLPVPPFANNEVVVSPYTTGAVFTMLNVS